MDNFLTKTMTYLILFILNLCCGLLSSGQNTILVDSLLKQLDTNIDKTLQIDILNELAWQLRKSNPDSAKDFALQGINLSENAKYKKKEATSLNRLGEIERLKGNFNQSIDYFLKALSIERAIDHKYGIARALSQLCTLYKDIGAYGKAMDYGKESLNLFIALDMPESVARSYQRLALVYQEKGETDAAITMLQKKLKIESKFLDQGISGTTMVSMGLVYYSVGSYNRALEYYNQAMKIWVEGEDSLKLANVYTNIGNVHFRLEDLKLAEEYNRKSISLKEKSKNGLGTAINYNNLGLIYVKQGDHDTARRYFEQSIAIKEKAGRVGGLAISYYNLANSYKRNGDIDSALYYFQNVIALKPESKTLVMETFWNLSEIYFNKAEYSNANNFKKKYGFLRDSLDLMMKATLRIKDDFEAEQKRSQILEKDLKIKETLIAKNNLLIYGLTSGIVLLMILFFFVFSNYRLRQKSIISDKNVKISQQKIDELLKNHELKEIGAMLEGQDKERKRIARELHDRLGSTLSMVKIHFKSVEENITLIQEQNKNQYDKANDLLDEACEEVRRIAHDMASGVLHKFGLIPALQSLEKSITETGQLNMKILGFGFDSARLDYEIEINTYRIVQELLSNVLKHAEASEMTVQVIKKDNNLNILVEDDGKGFDPNKTRYEGIGLKNVQARIDKLDGELSIDSGKGSGTTVNIDIPI